MAATPDPSPVLDARALVAGYQRDINILSGVSVRAWAGRIACVLGPNGTGKSTLLKTIFGFLRPIEGQVVYRGGDITGLAPHRMIARGITYLPQQPSLFPYLSVEINLRLGLWHARARDAAERIERAFGQFPVLREKRRQPAGQLSGGQQRQLEIARAHLTDPELYLIDEPTAGVDPITSAEVYRIIERLAHEEGKAILLVDQDIKRALAVADHVYVIRNGALFTEGPRDAFGGDTAALVSHWLSASGGPEVRKPGGANGA
jgi:branched-chain amino acid transport system ATP-binding protein